MAISKYIPTVRICCFYVTLVDGCYFTAFYNIYSALDFTFGILSTHVNHCWDDDNTLQYFAGYLGYFMGLMGIIVAVISFIFIWGMRKDKSFTAIWLICGMAAKTVGLIIFGIVLIFANAPKNDLDCPYPIVKIFLSFLFAIFYIYLMIVIWSYYLKMESNSVPEAAPTGQPTEQPTEQPTVVDTT